MIRPTTRRLVLVVALCAAGALSVGIGGMLMRHPRSPAAVRAPRPTSDLDAVAVLPFATSGADSSLAYLGDGMADLLSAALPGERGLRVIDPRTVLATWHAQRTVRGAAGDSAARAVARAVGAGHMIVGAIVGQPQHLVVTAILYTTADNRSDATSVRAQVDGPADSLASLVTHVTAQLLTELAGERDERVSALAHVALAPLRAYLAGQADVRGGRYDAAFQHYSEAVRLDSNFALAAVGAVSAAEWVANPDVATRVAERAWRVRDRLSAADRALLFAYVGRHYPADRSEAERLAGWTQVIRSMPERAEAWYEYGDVLFHWGQVLGVDEPLARSAAAFRRAVALDPTFAQPLAHLVDVAADTHDTGAVRGWAARYIARDPTSDIADYVRWRAAAALADSAGLAALRARFGWVTTASLQRIAGTGLLAGVDLGDVDRATAELRRRLDHPEAAVVGLQGSDDVRNTAYVLRDVGYNRGAPALVGEAYRWLATVEPTPGLARRTQIFDAVLGTGDSTAAAAAARELGAHAQPPASGNDVHALDHCVLDIWRVYSRLADGGRNAPASGAPGGVWHVGGPGLAGTPVQRCTVYLAAIRAVAERRPEAARLTAHLDTTAQAGWSDSETPDLNLATAQLWEAQNQPARALAALRRRPQHWGYVTHLATSLHIEAQLAATMGDRKRAAAADQQYRTLRTPQLVALGPEVGHVPRVVRPRPLP